ncbi:uncharacterized protein LOC123519870 [Portunus trituberculatus]|uniref:uncharacterized protein LOC123519870 n=1 Tax=Portunus trituberculatus TaxID=210409 RepID=UPI001E1D13F7|nr:uncharacterized protein LOC123519870 [Portunus trituberculatus]
MNCAWEEKHISGGTTGYTYEPWQKVMNNIMYFLYIVLPGASSSAKWSREAVDRAVGWGLHCEKAVARFKQGGTLQTAINKLARSNQQIGSVRDLAKARHLLLQRLLQNQLLEEGVREYVKQLCQDILGAEDVSRVESTVQQQQEHASILFKILAGTQYKDITERLNARLMLEVASNSESGQVGDCLSEVVYSPASLQTYLEVALLEEEEAIVEVGSAVARWIEEVVASPQHSLHRHVLKFLCSLSTQLLSKALARHPQLIMALLESLHRETLKLQPNYDDKGCHWQSCSSSVLSWDDLVKMYSVVASHQSMAGQVQEAVEGWSMEKGGAVWGEVVRQARATCMSASSGTSDSDTEQRH